MDPDENAARWNRWRVDGSESVISKVLSILDSRLPTGWKRLTGDDLLPHSSMVKQGSAWYSMNPTPSSVGVTLGLDRPRETELRGGFVWFAGPPSMSGESGVRAGWDQVACLLEEGIIPAAREAGASTRLPTPEEAFLANLPVDVRDRLRMFSDSARKLLPLNREEAALWRDFVVAAFRTKTIIDRQPFTDWLAATGWSREAAVELNSRFLDHCLLLSKYTDEVSVA